MQNLKETFLTELRIPDINGDRCVHAHIEQASCDACVIACPENAWVLDDEQLGLDTRQCDGCGLCVPACTEGAITQEQICTIREENQQKVLLLGCEYTGLSEANCKCIHAVSAHDLLKRYHEGIHQVQVCRGDCDQCSRGNNESLFQRISHLNKMLRHRHLPPLHYNELPAEQWQSLWKTPEKAAPGVDMSRRGFFRSALKQTVDLAFHHSTFDQVEAFKPLGKIFPAAVSNKDQNNELVHQAVPHINPAKCNGCDACIRSCPHGALQLDLENEFMSYQIDASFCTDCHICSDICDQDAIHLMPWTVQTIHSILLSNQKCDACGTPFHFPLLQKKQDVTEISLCNLCSKTNHQTNLFQVLE